MKLHPSARRALIAAAGIAALGLAGLATVVTAADTEQSLLDRAKTLFIPLPEHARVDDYPHSKERAELGKMLFFETRVSVDGSTSCAACHSPSFHGADSRALSIGVHGQKLPRNANPVFNTPLLIAQHYGGNRQTVEEQALKHREGAGGNARHHGHGASAAAAAAHRAATHRPGMAAGK